MTDSLFNSPACEAEYYFFRSLLVLQVNGYYGRPNKEKVDDNRFDLGSEVQKVCNFKCAIWKSQHVNRARIKEIMRSYTHQNHLEDISDEPPKMFYFDCFSFIHLFDCLLHINRI